MRSDYDPQQNVYTLYYDESNNVRKLRINEAGDGLKVDNDPTKVGSASHFLLAGVAYEGVERDVSVVDLFTKLRLQPTAHELSFGQVARGTFDKALKSRQLKTLLRWLLESDFYVHFFTINLGYWAIVDIIDDCIVHCLDNRKLNFELPSVHYFYAQHHKDALYRLYCAHKGAFLSIAKKHAFPAIDGQEGQFIGMLYQLTQRHLIELRGKNGVIDAETILVFQSLLELFELCLDIEDMTLVLEDEEGVLINGLSQFYLHRAEMFPNSKHVFDEESEVQAEYQMLTKDGVLPQLPLTFVRSIDSPLTQVCDVISGFFARYFDYIEKNTLVDLLTQRAAFSKDQIEMLNLMKELVEKTDRECPPMLHYIMSASEHQRHKRFLFPEET